MKLWLVRHAEPLIAKGVCYGRLDIEADAACTQAAARALAAEVPAGLPVKVSSLRRARQLAQALSILRADLTIEVDERLAEMDFGRWEGMPWETIPVADIDAWTRDFARYRAGGGETVSEVLRRVGLALDDTAVRDEAVWITHAGVMRAVDCLARHGRDSVPSAAEWPVRAPGYGACMTLEWPGKVET